MKQHNHQAIIKIIKDQFPKHAIPTQALAMENYMKNHFKFLGIKMPARKEFLKQIKDELKELPFEEIIPLMHKLWKEPCREYQYLAMDIAKKHIKKFTPNELNDIEELITTKSWWDTVDFLAVNLLGAALKHDKDLQYSYSDKLINADNMWLRRSAILFQLKYKTETDFDLLQAHILHTHNEQEFFIRKAAGWALREYSKTNPTEVKEFINNYKSKLSNLTVREGSKYI